MQLVLGWFIYLNRPGVRSPPLPAVGGSLWCGADGNFVLVVRMRHNHNQLQQVQGGSREFITPTGKIVYCNSLLIDRGMFVGFASGFTSGFQSGASSYRFGFGLLLIVSFWLWASAHRIVWALGFGSSYRFDFWLFAVGLRCFWASCFFSVFTSR